MVSIVVFAIVIFGMIVLASPSATSAQNDRIFLHPSFNPESSADYVKISDMEPNSFGYFMYPSSYNFSDSANAYQRFLLIRLPSWLGGDKNDVSSYRAYSMVDLDSHCMIKYWPQDGRQRIEDPCHFEMYRIIDGASYYFGIDTMSKPVENALPQLDLGADNDGYLYVKTPSWDVNKNGIVGDGRHLSKGQVLNTSSFMLEQYKKHAKNNIHIPLSFEDGSFLIEISNGEEDAHFSYTSEKPTMDTPSINISFCNCTGSTVNAFSDNPEGHATSWQVGNNRIYAYDPFVDNNGKSLGKYNFEFYQDGYLVIFNSQTSFDKGMKMTLDAFFNGTKLSDIEQVSIEK